MTDIATLIELVQPSIPITVDIWSSKECAAYLKVTPKYFMDNIASHPDFPEPKRIVKVNGEMRPRWKAMDVIKYVERK